MVFLRINSFLFNVIHQIIMTIETTHIYANNSYGIRYVVCVGKYPLRGFFSLIVELNLLLYQYIKVY